MRNDVERRNHRSENVQLALGLQLDACRRDADLEAIVLSDADGLPLALAGQTSLCTELAATVPLLDRGRFEQCEDVTAPRGGGQVSVQRFEIDASPLYLAVSARDLATSERQLARSVAGVARILRA